MIYRHDQNLEWAQTESGLIVPADSKKRIPKGFEFFAGCGGFSCGFIQAGFQIVGALEIDYSAAQTYMVNLGNYPIQIHFDTDERKKGFEKHLQKQFDRLANKHKIVPMRHDADSSSLFGKSFNVAGSGWISTQPGAKGCEHFWIADIKNITGKEILTALGMERGELDAVIGGPPCQGFSRAGNQDESDPRNILVWEYARMIVELDPKCFAMEEVPDVFDFQTAEGIGIIDGFLKILADGDFAPMESLAKAVLGRKNAKVVLRKEKKQKNKKPKSDKKQKQPKTQKAAAAQRSLF
jgi:Site-specific DNA methylase